MWVRDFQGRLICEALWNGHRSDFFPVSYVRNAAEQRAKGRLGRVDEKRAEIEAELNPATLIEMKPAVTIDLDTLKRGEDEIARVEARNAATPVAVLPGVRPTFGDDVSWIRWLAENPGLILPRDRDLLAEKLKEPAFRLLIEVEGIDVTAVVEGAAGTAPSAATA